MIETGEVTTATEGPVTDVTFDAGSSTDVISVRTEGTTFNSGDGITLRVRSASELAALEYRVGSPASAKVGVTEATRILTLATEHTNGVLAGDIILFDVTLTPPPVTETIIMVEAIDTGNSNTALNGTPISVTINPDENATSSSATGQITVASSGVTGPITLKFPDDLTGYTFDPPGKSLSVPLGTQTTKPNLTIVGK